jgi:anaerobic ribonucleoside-triphosphate reductase activating protein
MLNGDGLRVVLWVSGCTHCCAGCHNSYTWDAAAGLLFDAAAKAEIYDQLDKSYISGLTLSGGDPLHAANRLELREFAAEVREKYPQKTIWLYTGELWEHIYQEPLLKYVDILVDGKYDATQTKEKIPWAGSTNQRVIDVKKTLTQPDPSAPVLYT